MLASIQLWPEVVGHMSCFMHIGHISLEMQL